MSQQFVNREKELEFLKRTYSGRNSSMVIIYGRRRVGKSELVLQFSKNKKGLYFLCSTEGDRENIRALQNKFAALLGDDSFAEIRFERWHNLFSSLVNHKEFAKVTKKKFVLILDEFPYMITANPHIPSVFQIIWKSFSVKKTSYLY